MERIAITMAVILFVRYYQSITTVKRVSVIEHNKNIFGRKNYPKGAAVKCEQMALAAPAAASVLSNRCVTGAFGMPQTHWYDWLHQ